MKIFSKLKKPEATRILGGALGLLLVLSLVLVPAAPVSAAVPQMPHIFYGNVTSDGEPLPAEVIAQDISVEARINTKVYASATVDADSRYGWETPFEVPADDPDTSEKDGGVNGDIVEFYVAGVPAGIWPFEEAGRDELPLEADITAPIAPDAALMTVNMNAPGTADTIEGDAGAVEGDSTVEVWDGSDPSTASVIDLTTATAEGSFAPIDIGDNEHDAIWVTAKDAEDNRSDATEMANDIGAPAFVSVAVSDPDEFYKAGDTVSFDVDLGEEGLTVTADLTVLDSALASDFALADDEDGTYSGTTSALSSETMVEGVDRAVTLTATDAAGNPTTDDSLTLTIDKTAPTVESTVPLADAPDVAIVAPVTATFDEDVTLVDETGVSIVGSISEDLLTGVSLEGRTLTIGHEDFASAEEVTVTIASGTMVDSAGNSNTELSWSFTTVTVTVTYALTVDSTEGGTATDVTNASPYEADTEVSIKAEAAALYQFVNWTATAGVILDATQAETTFTMPAEAATVTANFELIPPTTYDLTMAAVPEIGGTASDVTGLSPYEEGAEVSIKAEPAALYQFVNWTATAGVILDATQAETTFTMPAEAATVTANFALIGATYDLTVNSTDGGSVTIPGEGVQGPYDAGAEVPLLAVAVEGYEFIEWTGDTGTIGDVLVADTVIIMTGNYEITANFAEEGVTYTLFVSSSDDGSVTQPGEGTFTYTPGTVVTLVADPDDGYELDSWTGDVADANAASTTITMNDNEVVHANFMLSLGDLIGDTPSGGTLVLPAGEYSGDVIIDEPITITGTEGTVIHGGIHIRPLDGSNVTIENVTITNYTDFGIRIIKVKAGDTFIIRNNTILGGEGSVVGIKVKEVVTGGSLNIRNNAISGNEVGIKLLANVADAFINFNDFTDNTIGLELVEGAIVSAQVNWWSDISGPEEENWNPGGTGNAVVGNIPFQDYQPWLTREFQTVLDDNIAYLGMAMVELNTGWNIISTPIALDPVVEWEDSDGNARTGVQTWSDYIALGDGLAIDTDATVYYFNGETQEYEQVLGTYRLKPCDAIYVKMAEPDVAAILLSPSVSVPSKELYAGWNLVSLAWLPTSMEDIYGLPADEALITVEEVTGSLIGYKLVVSPGVNTYESTWIYIAGDSIEPWTDPNEWPPPDDWMLIGSGYWVFMLNDGTLAGFAFTPVSLGM